MRLIHLFKERPIAYYPVLKEIAGSIEAAILLQQLLYWWDKKGGDELFKTIKEIDEETGLGRKEQDTCIKKLVAKGFIEVNVKGVPPRRHFKIVLETIENKLSSICTNRTNQFAPIGQINLPHQGKSLLTEITTEITSLTAAPAAEDKKIRKDAEIIMVLDAFRTTGLNPISRFHIKSDRQAAKDLITAYGLDKTIELVKLAAQAAAAKIGGDRFAPMATTACQLAMKAGSIKAWSANRTDAVAERTADDVARINRQRYGDK